MNAQTGQAVRIRGKGGVEVLALDSFGLREPGPDEVQVEIAAAGLNRADILQRRGFYPAPPGVVPDIPGLEFSGVVAKLGSDVRGFSVGDRVMGIAAGGAMATHINCAARELLAIPEGIETVVAAGIPEVFLTAYDAMFRQGALGVGQVVLVHAVASGVGTAALQLGLAAGAQVVGTSRTPAKLERCQAMGLQHAICVQDGLFADKLKALDVAAPQLIVDLVGAAYLGDNIKAAAKCGRIVVVGLLGGAKAELSLGLLLAKRASIIGTVLRSRPAEEKAALIQAFARDVLPLFQAGTIKPVIDSVLPMADIAAAHERMEDNAPFGKIVMSWGH